MRSEQDLKREEKFLIKPKTGPSPLSAYEPRRTRHRRAPPHVAQVPEAGQQFTDNRFGLAAVRALEVAVLYESYRCARWPSDMVTSRVDGLGEVDDHL